MENVGMLNKKGFTLVEVLSVIVLIALLFGIGIPGIMKISDNMKIRSYNTKVDLLEQAGELWGQDNKSLLQTGKCDIDSDGNDDYSCYKVPIKDLINEDYLESENKKEPEYKNPKDNKSMLEKCVYVYKKNNRVYAKYVGKDEPCDNDIITSINGGTSVLPEVDLTKICQTTELIPFSDPKLFSYQIICNAKNAVLNNTNGTKYSEVPLSSAYESLKTNEKTLSMTSDNYGNTYYFRGNIEDNYVNFAGMCWQILRIQGNGTIKLVLASDIGECTSENLSDTSGTIFTEEKSETDLYEIDFDLNILISSSNPDIFEYLELWKNYKIPNNYISYLQNETWFRNKTSELYDSFGNVIGTLDEIKSTHLDDDNFEAYYEVGYRDYKLQSPLLIYDTDTYDKDVGYVGALTADEMYYGGGKSSSSFLLRHVSSMKSLNFSKYQVKAAGNIKSNSQMCMSKSYGINNVGCNKITPSIVLKSDIQLREGNGTLTTPYILNIN